MNQTNPSEDTPKAGAPVTGRIVVFDHEKLEVYQLELQFIAWTTVLINEVSITSGVKFREVCDQLDRASLSSLLNTAEGNGKGQRQGRAQFFDDARASAMECAGCLDAIVAQKLATPERILDGKRLLVRIVSILCKSVERFDEGAHLHEDPIEYRAADFDSPVNYSRTRTRTKNRN